MSKKKKNIFKHMTDTEVIEDLKTTKKGFICMAIMVAVGIALTVSGIFVSKFDNQLMKGMLTVGILSSCIGFPVMFGTRSYHNKLVKEVQARKITDLLDDGKKKEKQPKIERVDYVIDTSKCSYDIDINLKDLEKRNIIEDEHSRK